VRFARRSEQNSHAIVSLARALFLLTEAAALRAAAPDEYGTLFSLRKHRLLTEFRLVTDHLLACYENSWTVSHEGDMAKSKPHNVIALRPVTRAGRKPNAEYRTREHLTQGEMTKLLAALKANRWGYRDGLIGLLIYRHGLRVSELCDLRWAPAHRYRPQAKGQSRLNALFAA
jgi:integrase